MKDRKSSEKTPFLDQRQDVLAHEESMRRLQAQEQLSQAQAMLKFKRGERRKQIALGVLVGVVSVAAVASGVGAIPVAVAFGCGVVVMVGTGAMMLVKFAENLKKQAISHDDVRGTKPASKTTIVDGIENTGFFFGMAFAIVGLVCPPLALGMGIAGGVLAVLSAKPSLKGALRGVRSLARKVKRWWKKTPAQASSPSEALSLDAGHPHKHSEAKILEGLEDDPVVSARQLQSHERHTIAETNRVRRKGFLGRLWRKNHSSVLARQAGLDQTQPGSQASSEDESHLGARRSQ